MSESHVAILPGVQQFLDRQHGLWIEGRQAASDSEKRLNVYNPATGEVIASTADASVDDVDRAVMAGAPLSPEAGQGVCRQSGNASCCGLPIWWNSMAKSWHSSKPWSRGNPLTSPAPSRWDAP